MMWKWALRVGGGVIALVLVTMIGCLIAYAIWLPGYKRELEAGSRVASTRGSDGSSRRVGRRAIGHCNSPCGIRIARSDLILVVPYLVTDPGYDYEKPSAIAMLGQDFSFWLAVQVMNKRLASWMMPRMMPGFDADDETQMAQMREIGRGFVPVQAPFRRTFERHRAVSRARNRRLAA